MLYANEITLLSIALLASPVTSFGADDPADSPGERDRAAAEKRISGRWAGSPICLSANGMSIATGKPSLVNMSSGSTHIPVWSLSGGTVGQSVAGLVKGFPSGCAAVKVEIVVTTTDKETSPKYEDVYRVHLSQMVEGAAFTSQYVQGNPVRTALPAEPFTTRTIVLESFYEVEPNAPLCVRVQREPDDPADSFTRPTGLAMVKVTPLDAPPKPHVVQDVSGYNSWPMIQAIGEKLVCVYSRGSAHSIGEDARAVYARTSTDNGKTWTAETVVADTPHYGEVAVGKGLDAKGAMFLWVRRIGKDWNHDLYRTTDGVKFELVATPKLAVTPMQITDVFAVPKVGLMALWFAGNYRDDASHSWGKLTSSDNGATWIQTTIESGLTKDQWPTEPSAVYLGNGRILAIGADRRGRHVRDENSIPDGVNGLWKDVDARADKHRRSLFLHAEPDPRRQNRPAEQLLLSARPRCPAAPRRRSGQRVRPPAQLARFRGGRHGQSDRDRFRQREHHHDRGHTLPRFLLRQGPRHGDPGIGPSGTDC